MPYQKKNTCFKQGNSSKRPFQIRCSNLELRNLGNQDLRSHTKINSNKHMWSEGIKKSLTLWANTLQEIIKSPLQCLWFQKLSCHSWSNQGLSTPVSLLYTFSRGSQKVHGCTIKLHSRRYSKGWEGQVSTGWSNFISIMMKTQNCKQFAQTGENSCKVLGPLGSLRTASN